MPKAELSSDSPGSLRMALADDSQWTILGADEQAARVVSELGELMHLRPGASGRKLYAVVCRERMHYTRKPSRKGTVVCWLAPLVNRDLELIQMERIAASIALESLLRGGLLLHGALAEYKGAGYVMAGPSGVGKSTASRRLPPPHRSLSDDRTLVVRDRHGRYWAHPWPTWSLLHSGASSSWPVEKAVPLRGFFFLSQSSFERLRPADRTHATAMIMESAIDVARTVTSLSEAGESTRLWEDHMAAAKALAAAVPAYSLETSLQGRFWTEIEQVLAVPGNLAVRNPAPGEKLVSPRADTRNGRLRAVCVGGSMNPTLAEADILEVEPYGRRSVRPGDVICFKSPENAEMCVRRVVSTGKRGTGDAGSEDGIRTRGDNNRHQDQWLLRTKDIAGRVVAVQSGSRWRPIGGGFWGQVTAASLIGVRPFWSIGHRVTDCLHGPAVKAGSLDGVLPHGFMPRLVEFSGRHWLDLKLLFAKREIGRYDCYQRAWRIRWPFRLFVDLGKLPRPTIWSRPSFARAGSTFRHPREVSGISAAPEIVSVTRYSNPERKELTDLSVSTPALSASGLAASTVAEEKVFDFVAGKQSSR